MLLRLIEHQCTSLPLIVNGFLGASSGKQHIAATRNQTAIHKLECSVKIDARECAVVGFPRALFAMPTTHDAARLRRIDPAVASRRSARAAARSATEYLRASGRCRRGSS